MIKNITKINERKWRVEISYADEGIDLIIAKLFIGQESEANTYATQMDTDAHANYAHLFPLPEPLVYEDEEMLI